MKNYSQNIGVLILGTKFYEPGKNAREEDTRKWLKSRWKDKYGY